MIWISVNLIFQNKSTKWQAIFLVSNEDIKIEQRIIIEIKNKKVILKMMKYF